MRIKLNKTLILLWRLRDQDITQKVEAEEGSTIEEIYDIFMTTGPGPLHDVILYMDKDNNEKIFGLTNLDYEVL